MHSFAPFWNPLHRSLISIFSLKIAEFFLIFYKIIVAKFARILLNFVKQLFDNFFRDFPKMQQFWEKINPKIAHLIFVLEMRTFNFRFEKHLIFIFTNI